MEKNKKRGPKFSPFSKEFWIEKGMSEENAILEAKSKRPTNKEYWIKKGYSEEDSINKIRESQSKKTKKLNEMKKNNPSCDTTKIEYWLKKTDGNIEEANKLLSKRQSTFSKEICIEKHGERQGEEIWKARQNKWISSLYENNDMNEINKKKAITLERMIEKHGDDGLEKYNNWKKNCVPTLINFIRKYGEEKGLINYKKYIDQLQGRYTLKWYKEKHGEILGEQKFLERIEKIMVKSGKASKVSLEVFNPLFNWLIDNNYDKEDLFWGVDDSHEWFIKNEAHIYFYDFTIKSKKIILEFHGKAFHPNIEKMTKVELNEWKQPFSKENAHEVLDRDNEKKRIAEKNGFILVELYEEDGMNYNLNKAKELINASNS